MRKFFIFLSIVAIVSCLSAPAFALGGSETSGTVVYSPALFDEWYSDGEGGPYDWLFNFYRAGTASLQRNFEFTNSSGYPLYDGNVVTTSTSFQGTLRIFEDDFTLVANNKLFRISACDNYLMYFNDSLRIKSVRIYGAYLIADRDVNGQVFYKRMNFDYKAEMGGLIIRSINLGTYLRKALSNKQGFDETSMFFEKLSIDFACEKQSVSTPYLTVTFPRSSASTIYYDFRSWANQQLDKFDTGVQPPEIVEFDIASFLGDTVTDFLDTPIFNDYSLGDVLGVALVLGVLMFALKMLV